MRLIWEDDTWWFEDLGVEGRWWWGTDTGRYRIRLPFPDKVAHFLFTAILADLVWRYAQTTRPSAAVFAFLVMWIGLEVRWLASNRVLWMGSWKDTVADLLGAVCWMLIR